MLIPDDTTPSTMDELTHPAHSPNMPSPIHTSPGASPSPTETDASSDEVEEQEVSINRQFKVLLWEHYQRGLIERHSCKMLFNMSMMLSAMRVGLQDMFILDAPEEQVINAIENWAGYVLEGCAAFQTHLDSRVAEVEKEIAELPMLDGVPRKTRQENIKVWQLSFEYVHTVLLLRR